MSELKIGLIGSGMMGHEHIRNILTLDGPVLAAVSDPDQGMRESAAALGGPQCQAFSDYRDMLEQVELDALLIASPNYTHVTVLEDVLKTDLPLLVEKPLCTTLEDCDKILELAENRKAPIWVAMEYRYMPPIAGLLDHVHQGDVGKLTSVTVREHRFPFLEKVGDWNRFQDKTGGTMVEKCCHFFDLMRLIVQSDPVRIYASGGMDVNHLDEDYDGQKPDIIDNAFCIIDFANGTRGMLELSMFAEGSYFQETVTAVGDKAKVEAFVPGPSRFWPGNKERHAEMVFSPRDPQGPTKTVIEVDETILAAGDHHGSTFYQLEKFCQMVQNGGTPEVSLLDGALAVKVGAAAEKSIKTGQPVLI